MENMERIQNAMMLLFRNPAGHFCYCTNRNKIIKLSEESFDQLVDIKKHGKLNDDVEL